MYLNTHTYYSFKYGTMSPEELLMEAQQCGIGTMALTNINTTAGCLNFVRLAGKYDIKPVVGIDFRNDNHQCFIGIARDNKGFKELNDFLSLHLHQEKNFPARAPAFQNAYIIYPFHSVPERLRENEYAGVKPRELIKLRFSALFHQKEKLVILQPVTFRNKRDFNAHRLLRAVANNLLLSKLPVAEQGHPDDRMLPYDQLLAVYEEFPDIIDNTMRLLESCRAIFDFREEQVSLNKSTYTRSEESDFTLIRRLCREGIKYRYPEPGQHIFDRLEDELRVIKQKGFISYFLINWDITKYARKKGYFYIGRGSGANSIVAYLLRITDVDPIDLDLYFERFINLFRKNPPDFDIDFSWRDREDVTGYIFRRFKTCALLATYSTFQYHAMVREIGKVFGLPPHEIDLLADEHAIKPDQMGALVLKYAKMIEGFPSHMSIHAGGILIAEKHIHNYSATSLPPKGFATTHFDMLVAEDIGLYKFDILGQRGLGKIKDSLALIKKNNPGHPPFDIHDIQKFKQDPEVKAILREGTAIGCFYVESPAMRMLLKKLKVDNYLGLVAASSIIRPGVAKSGMMREYVLRSRNPERRDEADPVLRDIMPETFGVMVYQEDVIKVANIFAGLSLAEADVLRRGMSGKFRSREEFQKVKEQFFRNCKERGRPETLTSDVWRQIESFAGYAFSKGHSASYAVESYQSLYLKAHYPVEYMVSTLNNGGGFYSRELYLHDARMHGATVEPPCVNKSGMECVVEGKKIYLGFFMVKELEDELVYELLKTRRKGLFRDMEDVVNRVAVSLEQLSLLIRVGAFRFTGKSKKALLWEAHFLLGHSGKSKPVAGLFDAPVKKPAIPKLNTYRYEDAFEEMELLGFPLCDPFELLRNGLEVATAVRDFPGYLGKEIHISGYLIAIKNTRTSRADRMYFGTFLDHEGQFIDTVHFPPVAARYPFRGRGIYRITGKVVEEFDFYSLEVMSMKKLPYIDDPRYTEDVDKLEVVPDLPPS